MKNKRLFTYLIRTGMIGFSVYVVFIFIQQQNALNSYRQQEQYYLKRIEEEQRKAEELKRLEAVYNTDEYTEKIARDKLGLVKPGEKIFIDASNR